MGLYIGSIHLNKTMSCTELSAHSEHTPWEAGEAVTKSSMEMKRVNFGTQTAWFKTIQLFMFMLMLLQSCA